MSQPPAGWYPQGGGERYWDGTQWTDHSRPAGQGSAPHPQQPMLATPYPQQLPRKRHTLRNVLLVVALLMVLAVGGCFALLAVAVDEADKAIHEELKNDTPTAVEEGAAFEHDGFSIASGWKVRDEEFGGATITGLKLTLTDDQGQTSGRDALLTFRLYDGKNVVTEIDCNGNSMQEGETTAMDCFSLDSKEIGSWDTIKVSDAW